MITRLVIAVAAVLAAIVLLVNVSFTDPRVTVRWREGVADARRVVLEQQYALRQGEPEEGRNTWRYRLGDRSTDNIRALVNDPDVADTGYIDRDRLTAPAREVHVRLRGMPFPFSTDNRFESVRLLFQPQSLWLLLAGAAMLWAAGAAHHGGRRNAGIASLLFVGAMGIAMPISQERVAMGDANQMIESRYGFESRTGVHAIRFESHLSYAVLGQLDRVFGRTADAPARAQAALARGATIWFAICAIAVGFLERWSASALRYLGLVLLAPSALVYFGWREFGYLSLNVAAVPFVVRGLRDGSKYLETGSVLCGLGAAFHGWGLVSLAGAGLAALVAPATLRDRVGRALRIAAWGTAAYVGWVAIYVIVLKLPIILGHVEIVPWRPLFEDYLFIGPVNPALLSAPAVRELSMIAWVVGAPLLIVAASLWRKHGVEVRTALAYALPSLVITLTVWHTQGPHDDMDVVFAVFPGFYALAWVCARDPRRTVIGAALLVSAHIGFWRIVFDTRFKNFPVT